MLSQISAVQNVRMVKQRASEAAHKVDAAAG